VAGACGVPFLQAIQTDSEVFPSSYSMGTVVLFLDGGGGGGKLIGWGMNLTYFLHLMLELRMSGTVPLLALCAFVAITDNFTLNRWRMRCHRPYLLV
jgi:hypothetical protein